MRPTLRRLLLLGLTTAVVVSVAPAGAVLDRYLEAELSASARSDLARAPMLLKDRNAARADALMMHARDVAQTPGLSAALARGAPAALALVREAAPPGETPVLVDRSGTALVGPSPGGPALAATRRGEAPVRFVAGADGLAVVSVAPVVANGAWGGAAGVARPVDATTAGVLAGLTGADVFIVAHDSAVATTVADSVAPALAAAAVRQPADGAVREVEAAGRGYWLASAPLGTVGRVVFALDVARELRVLPALRRSAAIAGAVALGLALLLAAALATGIARPVRSLATAADRLAAGDFHAPLAPSRIEEVDRMARAFGRMRESLSARLAELSRANVELAERQDRLGALQAELIRRDRLAASGRLVTELAHEIRNPVANIRNCLEVVHRRMVRDPEGRRFADLAIDELLRMHELAERMLDMNRPVDPGASRCDAAAVLERVTALIRAGAGARWPVELDLEPVPDVAMPPDTLKQLVLNLVQNAREAMPAGGRIHLTLRRAGARAVLVVADEGPGIDPAVLDRIFDPFFTTKGEVSGAGLGLFIAHGLAGSVGGRISAANRLEGGAAFRLDLPLEGARVAAGAGEGADADG